MEKVFNVTANKGRCYAVTLDESDAPRLVQSKVWRDGDDHYLRTVWAAESGKALSIAAACAVRAAQRVAEQS